MKNYRDVADSTDRHWSLPARPWSIRMVWHDLLFAHWQVPAELVQEQLPPGFQVDVYDGNAWIAVVPFRMSGVAPRGLFAAPWLSAFLELNVRTYVTIDGEKPGVWFFSLDAANPIAVQIARWQFNLPYMNATMSLQRKANAIDYHSDRTHKHEPPANFDATYQPIGESFAAEPGTLEYWLTARYCMYSQGKDGQRYRGEILHSPWELQLAEADIHCNTMLDPLAIDVSNQQPILHYAHFTDVVAWSNDPV